MFKASLFEASLSRAIFFESDFQSFVEILQSFDTCELLRFTLVISEISLCLQILITESLIREDVVLISLESDERESNDSTKSTLIRQHRQSRYIITIAFYFTSKTRADYWLMLSPSALNAVSSAISHYLY